MDDYYCDVCGEDVGPSSHYHCGRCGEEVSMMGHLDHRNDTWECDPERVKAWEKRKEEEQQGGVA